MIRLYGADFSTNAERVALALAYKGLHVESVVIDWFNRVWKRPPNEIEPRRRTGTARSLSAADVAAFPFLKYALVRDPADDEVFHRILDEQQRLGDDHPRLSEWIQRVHARPRA